MKQLIREKILHLEEVLVNWEYLDDARKKARPDNPWAQKGQTMATIPYIQKMGDDSLSGRDIIDACDENGSFNMRYKEEIIYGKVTLISYSTGRNKVLTNLSFEEFQKLGRKLTLKEIVSLTPE